MSSTSGWSLAAGVVNGAAAQVIAVFRDVGEVREVAERADHAHRAVAAQPREHSVEVAAGALVALQPVRDRELADLLDARERRLAFLLAQDVAEDAAEQPDVVDERLVLLCGKVRVAGVRGHDRR